ncbi:ELWxxDGT repeat protein [Lewinella sp. IMCC34183]|uniref:ELWxxDGT repeat protein n=1 Tax=Lewinella sp. IMCC34183 TaxID=2248762 RepID=UPI000E247AA0|nr:ELWxxDGT repeat protein [Lewinella sp. IMCC34183]
MKYLPTLGLLSLVLCYAPRLTAQSAERLTDFGEQLVADSYVQQVFVHNNLVYTANRSDGAEGVGRFALLDTESGALVPLADDSEFTGGYIPSRYSGAFQTLDGQLFATSYSFSTGYEIYRIDGTRVVQLTELAGTPLTELVAFDGAYYFLVRGRPYGLDGSGELTSYYTELWTTDGTPAGTERVEELAVLNDGTLGENPVTLTAGGGALLLGAQAPDQPVAAFRTYYLYRPDGSLTEVAVAPGEELDRATLYSQFGGEGRIAYFAGGFYLGGRGLRADRAEVYRIDEERGRIAELPGVLDISLEDYFEEEISFAATADRLYIHVAGGPDGYLLHEVRAQSPTAFTTLTSSREPSARIDVQLIGNTLLFGGSLFGGPGLLGYDIRGRYRDPYFRLSPGSSAMKLHVGEDVIYLTPRDGDNRLYRYQQATGVVDTFTNHRASLFGRYNVSADLRGDDLIYLGTTPAGSSAQRYATPLLLEDDAATARPVGPLGGGFRETGAYAVLGAQPDGSILFTALRAGADSDLYRYEAGSGTVSPLAGTRPGDLESPEYAGHLFGVDLFTAYDFSVGQYRAYVVRDGALVPLQDAATGEGLLIDDRFGLVESGVLVEAGTDASTVYDYTVSGETATRRELAVSEGIPEARRLGDYLAVTETTLSGTAVTSFDPGGQLRYAFDLPRGQRLLSLDGSGYFALDFRRGGAASLLYGTAAAGEPVVLPFPAGTAPDELDRVIQLGDKLLVSTYDGGRDRGWYVADAAAGTISLLADVRVGNEALRVGEHVYFAANDGVHGTELWRTDGTAAGTALVADLRPGAEFSDPAELYATADYLYFRARGEAGTEVYALALDGSDTVTRRTDINPGAGGSMPYDFLATPAGLYFLAQPAADAAFQLYFLSTTTTGIDAPRAPVATVQVYPNPVAECLVVESRDGLALQRIELFDAAGHRLRDQRSAAPRFRLDVSDLPPGTYFLRLRLTGGSAARQSVIIAR